MKLPKVIHVELREPYNGKRYLCTILVGELELREHKSARWLVLSSLDEVMWLPADKEIVEYLLENRYEE